MKKNTGLVLGVVILICVIIVGVLFWFDKPQSSRVQASGPIPIFLSADIEAERSFNAQVFWTEDETQKFHQKQSIRMQVTAGTFHLDVLIPTDIVHTLRFDFGSTPGKVTIKNIKLTGINPTTLDVNKFSFSRDVKTHEVVDDSLSITSDEVDPYAVYEPILDVVSD